MTSRRPWNRQELLVAFRLYCQTPFGKLHQHNPGIISLSALLGRTPSALAMKACNFAAFDPKLRARGIRALSNASRADQELWNEFAANSTKIAEQAEDAYALLAAGSDALHDNDFSSPDGPTEIERTVKTRCVQSFFRTAVLSSYDFRCAISDLGVSELLTASHIIPWRDAEERRADPRNGIALNALYDRAFDRGLLTLDEDYRVILSPRLRDCRAAVFYDKVFATIEGQPIRLPSRFEPDPNALAYHRESIFLRA
jgi:predicted restriction endonuclease